MVTTVPACTVSAPGAIDVKVSDSVLKLWLSQDKKNWAITNKPEDKSTGQFYKKEASSFLEGESL